MSTMFADTILIVFISVCTALLAEGKRSLSNVTLDFLLTVVNNNKKIKLQHIGVILFYHYWFTAQNIYIKPISNSFLSVH